MDIQICYCKACGIEYRYQASGEGCFDDPSTRDHCSECVPRIAPILEIIKNAKDEIEKINKNALVKGHRDWRIVDPAKTNGITFDILFNWMSSEKIAPTTVISLKYIPGVNEPTKMLECKTPYEYFNQNITFRIGMIQGGELIVEAYAYSEDGVFKYYLTKEYDN